MTKFFVGFALGFIIATTGVSNFTNFLESKLTSAQEMVQENIK